MKKIIKNSIITVLLVVIIFTVFPTTVLAKVNFDFEPRFNAPNGEPYYTRELNTYAQTGYGMPNCVAYAFGRIYELNEEMPKITKGDAGDWWFINKRNNYYEYGFEPKLGAVACWSNHVAMVERINSNGSITLSESHWGGKYFNTVTYSNMYNHYGQRFYGYIYTYDEPIIIKEEKPAPQYKMEMEDLEIKELNCFTALEFNQKEKEITTPTNNLLLNN